MNAFAEEERFAALREEMVRTQIVPRGISDKRVLEAMGRVPRHLFVPAARRSSSYDDCALLIGEGQTISQPYMVAIMTELLELKGSEKVLEVGTGSGYQAALLGTLAKKVYTVERVQMLADRASALLRSMGHDNIEVAVGDGSEGLAGAAPFDGIIVTAACPKIPEPLIEQLSDGGRLVLPLGERFHQILTVAAKKGGKVILHQSIGCVFVPLIGKNGFPQ